MFRNLGMFREFRDVSEPRDFITCSATPNPPTKSFPTKSP